MGIDILNKLDDWSFAFIVGLLILFLFMSVYKIRSISHVVSESFFGQQIHDE